MSSRKNAEDKLWACGLDKIFKKKIKPGAIASTTPNAPEYNMKHKYRGRAIVFIHTQFNLSKVSKQTKHEVMKLYKEWESLHKALKELHFDVEVYRDYDYNTLTKIVQKVSAKNHSDCDCLLFIIISSGSDDFIYARDQKYKLESISSLFEGHKCPTLAGKPKLFIVQAAREMETHTVLKTATDGAKLSPYRIPAHADFLFVYSTTQGPSFIQALAHELDKLGRIESILTVLTYVNQRVIHDTDEPLCIMTSLTRVLKFSDKVNMYDKSP